MLELLDRRCHLDTSIAGVPCTSPRWLGHAFTVMCHLRRTGVVVPSMVVTLFRRSGMVRLLLSSLHAGVDAVPSRSSYLGHACPIISHLRIIFSIHLPSL